MKRIALFISVCSIAVSGCDYVDVPNQVGGNNGPLVNDTVRRILIEDFTGHTCVNCPDASIMLDSLQNVFTGQVVGVAVHTGFYAAPCPPAANPLDPGAPAGSFAEAFEPAESSSYDAVFGSLGWPLPQGLVNRVGYPSGIPSGVTSWPSLAATELSKPITAYLKINPTYNSLTRVLNVSVTGQFMVDTNGTFAVTIYLVEDSLIGYQLDNNVSLGYDSVYVFNHVLRACINSPGSILGDTVATGSAIQSGMIFNFPMSGTLSYTVPAAYDDTHCRLVAYIYRTDNYNVVQAAEADLQ
jgi:hypothetical protein